MNKLSVITKFYSKLHNYKGLPFWVLTPLRRMTRAVANNVLPSYLANSPRPTGQEEADIIVSFTSFPARIDKVWLVVECMLRQSLLPKKIILWLSKEQFPTSDSIPGSLKKYEDNRFEVRFVDGDIRSHKKYYYISQSNPNDLVFLIDDDIFYPIDILERSYQAYNNNPDKVICNYGYQITHDEKGMHNSYLEWHHVEEGAYGKMLFFGSGGGTLFRPSMLDRHLTDIDMALRLTPTADDIWLNAMTKLANVEVVKLPTGLLLPIHSKSVKLSSTNNGNEQNDVQIRLVEDCFGTIF